VSPLAPKPPPVDVIEPNTESLPLAPLVFVVLDEPIPPLPPAPIVIVYGIPVIMVVFVPVKNPPPPPPPA
jgi:hypothetical protein